MILMRRSDASGQPSPELLPLGQQVFARRSGESLQFALGSDRRPAASGYTG